MSGHRAEQQYLSLAQPAWDSHQRLLAVRRTAARRNREGVRERQESRHVRRGDSQGEAQLQEPTEHDRTLLVGVSQPVRNPLRSGESRPEGRTLRQRERRGRARRASDEQLAGSAAARPAESRRQPGLSRLAGPVRLPGLHLGGVQPGGRTGRRPLPAAQSAVPRMHSARHRAHPGGRRSRGTHPRASAAADHGSPGARARRRRGRRPRLRARFLRLRCRAKGRITRLSRGRFRVLEGERRTRGGARHRAGELQPAE